MSFENVAEVGDVVRAYDFEPMSDRPDRFVEGVVVEKGFITDFGIDGFRVRVTKDTAFPEDMRDEIVAPFAMMFLEFDGRITKVEA